jgi:hypothetical protein
MEKITEELLWKKIDLLMDTLDTIIKTHADSGTLKNIAIKTLQKLKE